MALPANAHKIVTGLLVVGVLAWVFELFGESSTSFLYSSPLQTLECIDCHLHNGGEREPQTTSESQRFALVAGGCKVHLPAHA